MNTDEIKTWRTHSTKYKVCAILMGDGVSFTFDPENGIEFTAPTLYVESLKRRLVTSYGCSVKPVIKEVK